MLEIISKELHESAKIRGQLIAFQFNNTMRSKRQAIDRRRLRRRIDVSSQRTIRRRHAIPSGSADAFDRACMPSLVVCSRTGDLATPTEVGAKAIEPMVVGNGRNAVKL